jgi:hypothetical protein
VSAADGAIGLFARPLKGGQILVQRVIKGAEAGKTKGNEYDSTAVESSRNHHHKGWISRKWTAGSSSSSSSGSSSSSSSDEASLSPADASNLDEETKAIEEAYAKARKFLKAMLKFDADGNRSLDRNELLSFLGEEKADKLLNLADTNSSNGLTFTELAWQIEAQSPR